MKTFLALLFVFAVGVNTNENVAKIRSKRATEYLTLTENQKKLIVEKHNELRRIVIPSASDMMYMSWDKDLENLAVDYSRKCIYEHNKNRDVDRFSYVGENLFLSYGTTVDDNFAPGAVESWDSEKSDYTFATDTCAPGKVCGHYTQTAWAKSYKVGCGMTTCGSIEVSTGKTWYDATIVVCNYGPGGNYQGQKPYTSGPACTKCASSDTCVDNLCTNSTRDAMSGGSQSINGHQFSTIILILPVIIQANLLNYYF